MPTAFPSLLLVPTGPHPAASRPGVPSTYSKARILVIRSKPWWIALAAAHPWARRSHRATPVHGYPRNPPTEQNLNQAHLHTSQVHYEPTRTLELAARRGSSIPCKLSSRAKENNLDHFTAVYQGLQVIALLMHPGVRTGRCQVLEDGNRDCKFAGSKPENDKKLESLEA